MNGHGPYVWGAYAVAALLMLVEAVLAVRRHRQALRQARHAEDEGLDDEATP